MDTSSRRGRKPERGEGIGSRWEASKSNEMKCLAFMHAFGMCKLTCYMAMMLSLPLFDDNLCKFRVQNLSKFSLEEPYMHRTCITRRD
jgi:hypothetical protein